MQNTTDSRDNIFIQQARSITKNLIMQVESGYGMIVIAAENAPAEDIIHALMFDANESSFSIRLSGNPRPNIYAFIEALAIVLSISADTTSESALMRLTFSSYKNDETETPREAYQWALTDGTIFAAEIQDGNKILKTNDFWTSFGLNTTYETLDGISIPRLQKEILIEDMMDLEYNLHNFITFTLLDKAENGLHAITLFNGIEDHQEATIKKDGKLYDLGFWEESLSYMIDTMVATPHMFISLYSTLGNDFLDNMDNPEFDESFTQTLRYWSIQGGKISPLNKTEALELDSWDFINNKEKAPLPNVQHLDAWGVNS